MIFNRNRTAVDTAIDSAIDTAEDRETRKERIEAEACARRVTMRLNQSGIKFYYPKSWL